jgi:hypothetical protein
MSAASANTDRSTVEPTKPPNRQSKRSKPIDTVRTHLRLIAHREWQLWIVAILVSFVLLAGLMGFILPGLGLQEYKFSLHLLPPVVQGLVALVLIFDIYTTFSNCRFIACATDLRGAKNCSVWSAKTPRT